MKKIWPFTFYFLYFAAFASVLPFFVLFYQGLGFNGSQIGLLTGVPPLVTLVAAPFLTGVADSTQRHHFVIGLGIIAAVVIMLIMPAMKIFGIVFLLVIVFNIFVSPITPLADSATIAMLGEEGAMYGRIRLGGTIGWGVFGLIGGVLLDNYGLRILFLTFAVIMSLNFFASQKFSFDKPDENTSERGGIRIFLSSRPWILFLLLSFLGGMGVFSVATYLSPYMEELGANGNQIGVALFISTCTELPVFFFGDRLVRRFTARGLFIISLVLIGLRSILYAAVDTPYLVFAVQAVSGTIFPAMWVAGVTYADENAPLGLKSTAQGLFGAMTFGIGAAASGFMGGPLLESIGGRGMFLVFGIVILAGLVVVEAIRKWLPETKSVY